MGEQGARPARLVKMAELARVLGTTRRTIERRVRAGEMPMPVRLGENSVAFTLEDLLKWAREKHRTLAAELERLAFSHPGDVLPEGLEKAIAREMSKQIGQRVSADNVIFGVVGKLPEEEAAQVAHAQFEGFWLSVYDGFAKLDYEDARFVAYGLFPALRAQADRENAALGKEIRMPHGLSPLEVALAILAMPAEERARLKEERAQRLLARQEAAE